MVRVTLQVRLNKGREPVQSPREKVQKCKGTGVGTCLICLGDSGGDWNGVIDGEGARNEAREVVGARFASLVGLRGDLDTYSIDCFEKMRVRTVLANLLEIDCCGVCVEKQGD